jgi:hypothetical protein
VPGEYERRGGELERADAWVEINVGTGSCVVIGEGEAPASQVAPTGRVSEDLDNAVRYLDGDGSALGSSDHHPPIVIRGTDIAISSQRSKP